MDSERRILPSPVKRSVAMTHVPLILVADDVPANVELLFDQLHVLGFRAIAATRWAVRRSRRASSTSPISASSTSRCPRATSASTTARRASRCAAASSAIRAPTRIPVIFVTALNDTTDRVKAIEAGGDDFLTKPHNRLVLGARVRSLLKLKAATDALEDSYRKLRELEKVRDDLMKMIVHDLKTPLTSVLATLEMLLDGDFGARDARRSDACSATPRRRRRICWR